MTIASNFPAVKPSLMLDFANTKRLDPRVTFTRATTGTYYDGVTTAKAEENLHIKSQEFDDSAWQKTGVSVTADSTTAPDGTSTAELIAEDATSATHQITGNATNNRPSVISGQIYAFSVFLKKGTGATAPDIFQVSWGGAGFSTNAYVNFNLSTGTVSASGADASNATITSVGSSWYRCSFTATATSSVASSIGLFFVQNNGSATRAPSYTGVTTADVFAWGAQVEQRSSVTSYTATTTQAITNYIPVLLTAASGVPRFDHNPTTDESLGFLIEEQRTNICLQSEDLDTTWSETRATLALNNRVSPAGTLTVDTLIASTDNDTHFTTQTFTGTAASYTFSVYAKSSGLSHVALRLYNGSSQVGLAYYNLSTGATGTVTAGTASIQSVGNGFYRCILTATLAASASCTAEIYLANADNSNSFAGDAFNGVSLWGMQVELGAFPTSYIATTSATVTRNADAASMTGTNFSSWYNAGEGTIYADWITGAAGTSRYLVSLEGAAESTRIDININTSNIINPRTVVSGSAVASLTAGTYTSDSSAKIAFGYKNISYASSLSGVTAVTASTAGLIPPNLSSLQIGRISSGGYLNGTIRKLAYYPLRVTNAQLQALTS
jgi:hypothetical protein